MPKVTVKNKKFKLKIESRTFLENAPWNNQTVIYPWGNDTKVLTIQGSKKLMISDLDEIRGLENLVDLEVLLLCSHKITEIKKVPIPNLKALFLIDNQISEIKHLKTYSNLGMLNLERNKIKEIKGLEFNSRLKVLNLGNNQISEIKGLGHLESLEVLNLERNNIKEIKGLENLTRLKVLALNGNQIEEIKGLENLQNLLILFIRDNPVFSMIKNQFKLGNKTFGFEGESFDDILNAQEVVNYCSKKGSNVEKVESSGVARPDKLIKLIRVSESVKISQIVRLLAMSEDETYDKLINWADQYGMTLDQDIVKFSKDKKEQFLVHLEKEFHL